MLATVTPAAVGAGAETWIGGNDGGVLGGGDEARLASSRIWTSLCLVGTDSIREGQGAMKVIKITMSKRGLMHEGYGAKEQEQDGASRSERVGHRAALSACQCSRPPRLFAESFWDRGEGTCSVQRGLPAAGEPLCSPPAGERLFRPPAVVLSRAVPWQRKGETSFLGNRGYGVLWEIVRCGTALCRCPVHNCAQFVYCWQESDERQNFLYQRAGFLLDG